MLVLLEAEDVVVLLEESVLLAALVEFKFEEAPCETTTQFEKPPPVRNATRHKFPAAPPVQVVLSGRTADSGSKLGFEVWFATPFCVIWRAASKASPLPVASTVAVTVVEPSAPRAKLLPVTLKDPSAAAGTAVELSILEATSIVPQSAPARNGWTSSSVNVPATPRAGITPTSAATRCDKVKRRAATTESFEENMAKNQGK